MGMQGFFDYLRSLLVNLLVVHLQNLSVNNSPSGMQQTLVVKFNGREVEV
jgi:hypothetical protein